MKKTKILNKEYNVGEMVWCAKYERQEVKKTCPICFGKMRVRVILGDESIIETDCTYCEIGFQKYGYIIEYEYVSAVEQVEITHKEVNEVVNGRNVEYRYGSYFLTRGNAFDTKKEAENALLEKIKNAKKEDLEKLEYGKDNNLRKYSWYVGYYQMEKRGALKKIEYCDRKIEYFKSKVKEEKTSTNLK